jgi:pyruvate/2-oxoglutarate dehydrogenase complex dihydrolipoamide dehydrogenase (E3) component
VIELNTSAELRPCDDGYVQVNERLETTAPEVWAVGDVAGSPKFTHISVDDFRVVLANIAGGKSVTAYRQVPSCLCAIVDFPMLTVALNRPTAPGSFGSRSIPSMMCREAYPV